MSIWDDPSLDMGGIGGFPTMQDVKNLNEPGLPSFIFAPTASACFFVCVGISVNFAHNGMYIGITKGIGLRVEAGVGANVGLGTVGGKDNASVECGGLLGEGPSFGMDLPPLGDGLAPPTGGTIGWGLGAGAGCSINFTDYTKIY